MRRKTLQIIALTLVCISQILIALYLNSNISHSKGPQNNTPEVPEGPEFVIPESPLGILGLTSALAAALGVFAVAKKRKNSHRFPAINLF